MDCDQGDENVCALEEPWVWRREAQAAVCLGRAGTGDWDTEEDRRPQQVDSAGHGNLLKGG